MRFQFKGKEGINAKILKDIKFPIDFDAFELCTPALQERLVPMRSAFKEHDEAELARQAKLKEQHRSDTGEKPPTVAKPYSFKDGRHGIDVDDDYIMKTSSKSFAISVDISVYGSIISF